MTRALSLTWLSFWLIGLGGVAQAGKPSIAVLGIEVVDQTGTPTPADTQVAKELTDALRGRAKAGTGIYQYAAGSDKELIDVKLLNNCDDENAACMSAIGTTLNAEAVMYGKIDKQGKAYQVTLKLLDVHKKVVDKRTTSLIPLSQATGTELQGWAKKIYGGLTGQSTTGTLVVRLNNAERGAIFVDNEAKGTVTNSVGQVANLADGKYKVAIESDGFRRWEQVVTINAGETSNVPVELEKKASTAVVPPKGGDTGAGPGSGDVGHPITVSSSGSGVWKGVFVASVVVGLGGAALILYGKSQISSAETALCNDGGYYAKNSSGAWASTNPGVCKDPTMMPPRIDAPAIATDNTKGDHGHTETVIGTAVAIGAGGLALLALYKGFIAKDSGSSDEHADKGHRVRRDRFVVTPILSPNGGGATLQFDW